MAKQLTQNEMILAMLKEGWVTPLDALFDAGCSRLASRIHDLTDEGHDIERDWYEYESKFGKKKVRKYRIKPEPKAETQTDMFGERD